MRSAVCELVAPFCGYTQAHRKYSHCSAKHTSKYESDHIITSLFYYARFFCCKQNFYRGGGFLSGAACWHEPLLFPIIYVIISYTNNLTGGQV